MSTSVLPAPLRCWLAALALAGFLAVGLIGPYRYVDNHSVDRGFAPPHDPPDHEGGTVVGPHCVGPLHTGTPAPSRVPGAVPFRPR